MTSQPHHDVGDGNNDGRTATSVPMAPEEVNLLEGLDGKQNSLDQYSSTAFDATTAIIATAPVPAEGEFATIVDPHIIPAMSTRTASHQPRSVMYTQTSLPMSPASTPVKHRPVVGTESFLEQQAQTPIGRLGPLVEHFPTPPSDISRQLAILQPPQPASAASSFTWYSHTFDDEIKSVHRLLICSVPGCEKAFKTKNHLQRHHRTHTGDKPFTCDWPECGRKFSRKDNMQQHLSIHTSTDFQPGPVRRKNGNSRSYTPASPASRSSTSTRARSASARSMDSFRLSSPAPIGQNLNVVMGTLPGTFAAPPPPYSSAAELNVVPTVTGAIWTAEPGKQAKLPNEELPLVMGMSTGTSKHVESTKASPSSSTTLLATVSTIPADQMLSSKPAAEQSHHGTKCCCGRASHEPVTQTIGQSSQLSQVPSSTPQPSSLFTISGIPMVENYSATNNSYVGGYLHIPSMPPQHLVPLHSGLPLLPPHHSIPYPYVYPYWYPPTYPPPPPPPPPPALRHRFIQYQPTP